MKDYSFLHNVVCCFYPRRENLNDLFVLSVGYERCAPNKTEINSVINPKTDYIMHYVIGGRGFFQLNGVEYVIEKDTLFFIPPNARYAYKPDAKDPWYYIWVEFSGPYAHQFANECKLSLDSPCVHFKTEEVYERFAEFLSGFMEDMYQQAVYTMRDLYQIFAAIANAVGLRGNHPEVISEKGKNSRLYEVIHYIDLNYYQHDLSLNILSMKFHFDPSYLSKIFHREIGKSLSQYIMDLRLCKAFELLQNTDMMVKEVSIAVGYPDTGFFSKLFKRKFGASPSLYFKKYISKL